MAKYSRNPRNRSTHNPAIRRPVAALLLALIGCVSAGLAVRAYTRRSPRTLQPATLTTETVLSPAKPALQPATSLRRRLTLQPEAMKFAGLVGQRFLAPGREVATCAGSLTIGAEHHKIRFVRTQQDDGEQVAIALDAGPASLTWDARGGARSSGANAAGVERSLIERLVLDSPDQFILAQARGASYYTVARNVLPASAGGSDDYDGPIWDVIRIGEPQSSGNQPLSRWRIFHVNSSTGLIDRSISDEQGATVVAEISGWMDQLGEKVATHITWSQKGQPVMELILTDVTYGPRQ